MTQNKFSQYDYVILGAGIYGLYAASLLAKKTGVKILILERDKEAFQRATLINQARVHNGYHYPRSLSTALKSAFYFERFNRDFDFAINSSFKKIYALAKNFSYTDAEQFEKFCQNAHIPCKEVPTTDFFNNHTIEKAYETKEFSFDAKKIRDSFLKKLSRCENVSFRYETYPISIHQDHETYTLTLNTQQSIKGRFVVNATYASINQVLDMFNFEKFKIKYEICEIILCDVSENIKDVGLTVMDGPFLSIMPFGLTGTHSLTAVEFTPHLDSYTDLPTFQCQNSNTQCTPYSLENCNFCQARPQTSWKYMSQLAKKFLNENIDIHYKKSYFAIKPILKSSELDDSRPTVIRTFSENPTFISVLSGKINTIYDLDETLL